VRTASTLRAAFALASVAWLEACGGGSRCPPASEPEESVTAGSDEGAERPALRGAYRIVELAGEPVVETLVRDPSCYAGRALFTFGDDATLSFRLETACSGNARYETVCTAELTTSIEWDGDSFRVPSASRARGMVSQFYQPPAAGEDVALADGESESGHDFDDACHVGLAPMRWRIEREDGNALELVNEHGDTMSIERETNSGVDWRTLTREARAQRGRGQGT
jgi:hypothetical protein